MSYIYCYLFPAVIAAIVCGANFDYRDVKLGAYLRRWAGRSVVILPLTFGYFWILRPTFVGPFWGMTSLAVVLPLVVFSLTLISYSEVRWNVVSRLKTPIDIWHRWHNWILFASIFGAIVPAVRLLDVVLISLIVVYVIIWIYLKAVARFVGRNFEYREIKDDTKKVIGTVEVYDSKDAETASGDDSKATKAKGTDGEEWQKTVDKAAIRTLFKIAYWVSIPFVKPLEDTGPEKSVPIFPKSSMIFGGFAGLMLVISIVWSACGSIYFHAQSFASLIGEVAPGGEWKDFPLEGFQRSVIVEKFQAEVLGSRALGQSKEKLGSRFHPSHYTKQRVQGKTLWVAPLEFNDLRHFWTSRTSPGYVVMGAEINGSPPVLVDKRGENKIQLRYLTSAWSWQNLSRHIYTAGYRGNLEVLGFELDEDMAPWWVVCQLKPTVAYGAPVAMGCLLVSPETGEIQPYELETLPRWVDTALPASMAMAYANYWGEFRNGLTNRYVASQGIIRSSVVAPEKIPRVWDKNGEPYYVFDMSITRNGEGSLVSYLLINSRSGKATEYSTSGVDSIGARSSVLGMVSNYSGWDCTNLTPRIVAGREIWTGPVLSRDGVFKEYAIVDQRESKGGKGLTLADAMKDYVKTISSRADSFNGPDIKREDVTIKEIVSIPTRDEITYSFLLEEDPGFIMSVSGVVSPWLPFSKAGDKVSISYMEIGENRIVLSFENLKFRSNQ